MENDAFNNKGSPKGKAGSFTIVIGFGIASYTTKGSSYLYP